MVLMRPALSIASSSYEQRQAMGKANERNTLWRQTVYYAERINALGLLLMGFAFAMILLPFTLVYNAENGYQNRECFLWALNNC